MLWDEFIHIRYADELVGPQNKREHLEDLGNPSAAVQNRNSRGTAKPNIINRFPPPLLAVASLQAAMHGGSYWRYICLKLVTDNLVGVKSDRIK